jgi:hypothetical protein
MLQAEEIGQVPRRATLRNSTTVFLVGNIEPTMEWCKQLGFHAEYYPPGFAILRRDDIEIFLQQQPGYVAPDDPGRRERQAWNVYIITDNVDALYEEFSTLVGLQIARQLCPQDYGMIEFDLIDLNGAPVGVRTADTSEVVQVLYFVSSPGQMAITAIPWLHLVTHTTVAPTPLVTNRSSPFSVAATASLPKGKPKWGRFGGGRTVEAAL